MDGSDLRGAKVTRRLVLSIRDQAGFSLVETMAALFVFSIIMGALAATMISSYRAVRDTRFLQQATSLGNEAIEDLRNLPYTDLVLKTSNVAGDHNTTGNCTGLTGIRFFDPDGSGPMTCEEVILANTGAPVTPHETTRTINGTEFTVARYVTWVDSTTQGGSSKDYKRISVVVTWEHQGSAKFYRASTLVTDARRGLPIPKFDLTPANQQVEVQKGTTVTFPHSVRNLGITDAYDLDIPVPAGKDWSIRFYKDEGEIGTFDASDTLLTDTNGTGVVDTGPIETNQIFPFLAVWDLSPAEPNALTTLSLTARSGVDDEESTTVTDVLKVTNVYLDLFFHNRSTAPTSDTTTLPNMPMDPTAPTASTLYRYSTNLYSGSPGRLVDRSSSGATTAATQTAYIANWAYQIPTTTTLDGEGVLDLYVAQKDLKCNKTPTFTYWLRDRSSLTSDAGTVITTGTATSAPSGKEVCDFRKVSVNFNISNYEIATNSYLEFKLRVDDSTADAALFAYDTTLYRSRIRVPKASS